jgi:hypothetical protein
MYFPPPDGFKVVKLKTRTDYTGRQISFALSMTLLFLDMRSLNHKKGRRLAVIKVKLAKREGRRGGHCCDSFVNRCSWCVKGAVKLCGNVVFLILKKELLVLQH